MIVLRLTNEQRALIVAQLSGAALKRLKGLGVDLTAPAPQPIADPAAAMQTLALDGDDVVCDADGFLWLAVRPLVAGDELWLEPFDDRMAFQIVGQPGSDQPPRTHAMHPTAVPVFPLTRLDTP